jgi:hypothetical protein
MVALAPIFGPACTRSVRPGDPSWPNVAGWERLNRQIGGQLITVRSPLADCGSAPQGAACAEIFKRLKNPYYLGAGVGLTQTLGWVEGTTPLTRPLTRPLTTPLSRGRIIAQGSWMPAA